LRDLGNTVLVVEHDEETISAAPITLWTWVRGQAMPAAHLVATGPPRKKSRAMPNRSTGRYLSGDLAIAVPAKRRSPQRQGDSPAWLRGQQSQRRGF